MNAQPWESASPFAEFAEVAAGGSTLAREIVGIGASDRSVAEFAEAAEGDKAVNSMPWEAKATTDELLKPLKMAQSATPAGRERTAGGDLLKLLKRRSANSLRPWEAESPAAEQYHPSKEGTSANPLPCDSGVAAPNLQRPLPRCPAVSAKPWETEEPSADLLSLLPGVRAQTTSSGPRRSQASGRSADVAFQQTPHEWVMEDAVERFLDQNPILELLGCSLGEGVLRRVASTSGGEFAGPCPLCGGQDRLRVWPSPPQGFPRAWCRQCQASGDALHWATRLAGRDPGARGSSAQTLRDAGLLEPLRGRRNAPAVRTPRSRFSNSANSPAAGEKVPSRGSHGGFVSQPFAEVGRGANFSRFSKPAAVAMASGVAGRPGGATGAGNAFSTFSNSANRTSDAEADLVADAIRQLPGSRITSAAADAVAIEAVFSGLDGTSRTRISSCYVCRGTSWWRLRDSGRGEPGDWFCARCHAPVPAETRIERCDAEEVRP
jgi:hypothetical protein